MVNYLIFRLSKPELGMNGMTNLLVLSGLFLNSFLLKYAYPPAISAMNHIRFSKNFRGLNGIFHLPDTIHWSLHHLELRIRLTPSVELWHKFGSSTI